MSYKSRLGYLSSFYSCLICASCPRLLHSFCLPVLPYLFWSSCAIWASTLPYTNSHILTWLVCLIHQNLMGKNFSYKGGFLETLVSNISFSSSSSARLMIFKHQGQETLGSRIRIHRKVMNNAIEVKGETECNVQWLQMSKFIKKTKQTSSKTKCVVCILLLNGMKAIYYIVTWSF